MSCSPGNEDQLVPLAAILLLEVKIVHGPSALVLRDVRNEVVVIRGGGSLQNHNLGQVRAETVDDVFVFPSELDLGEGCQTLIVETDSGGLRRNSLESAPLWMNVTSEDVHLMLTMARD